MKKRNKGILYILMAAFFFAAMSMFVKLAGEIPTMQKCFFRNLIALVFAFAILKRQKLGFTFDKAGLKLLLLRSACGTIGMIGYFYAIDHLLLADASMLHKLTPFFAIIFSSLFLKERTNPLQWVSVIIAFSGSLLIVKPTFELSHVTAALSGLVGAIGAGAAYTCVRRLGSHGVKSPVIVLFFSAFSCAVTLPYVLVNYTPMSPSQLIFLLLAGAAAAGGQFSVTAAYFTSPAKEISVFDYSQVIFTAIFGFLAFEQLPDAYSIAGYVIIISSAAAMFIYNNRKSTADTSS